MKNFDTEYKKLNPAQKKTVDTIKRNRHHPNAIAGRK